MANLKTKLNLGNLYLYRAKIIMSVLGVWVPRKNETILFKFYRYFMVSLQYLFLIFQVIYMAGVLGDLEEVSQSSFLLFTQACLCFKVTVFLVNMDSFKELLGQMDSEVFRPQTKDHEQTLKQHAARIKRLLMGFMVSSQTTCSLFALRPLFDDANRNFPFKMWMPVSPEPSPQYELGFLFQLLTISMSAFMFFGVDSVCLSMVIFGCAQMDIIKEKLLSISSTERKAKESTDMNVITTEHYGTLIECIVQHQCIVRFIQLLEDTYHSYLFFQLTGSIGLICMTALRILVNELFRKVFALGSFSTRGARTDRAVSATDSKAVFQLLMEIMSSWKRKPSSYCGAGSVNERAQLYNERYESCTLGKRLLDVYNMGGQTVEWKSVQFVSMVMYLAVMSAQLFLCCWSGHELTATSSELHTVLYQCCWYEHPAKFRRALLFTMMRVSRPMEFRAGGYVTLSRQTFVSILRMSYSYFAVLKQTNSRNEITDNLQN